MTAPPVPAALPQEVVSLGDLRPHPRNYRQHPDDQLDHLEESIREHGLYRNIVVARDGTILAGHGVVQALARLGVTTVPVRRLDLDPDSPRALKLLAADNEIGHLAAVDDRALAELLRDIGQEDPDGLLGTGYDEAMLANLLFVTRPASEIADHNEAAHWAGLPGYEEMEEPLKLVVSFRDEADRAAFGVALGVALPPKARSIWWPAKDREDRSSVVFDVPPESDETPPLPGARRDPASGLWHRPDTVDLDIIQGDARSYARRVPVLPTDRVLDIGAHVGGSMAAFDAAGAALVVGVEPDPDNYALCAANAPAWAVPIHAAAVAGDIPTVTLWRNLRPRGTVFHSLTPHKGREAVEVPAVSFAALLADYRPTYLKLDCEGGEYDLLDIPLPACVRAVVVEFHANHKSWPPRIQPAIDALLAQGFVPDRDPQRPTPTAWVWVVGWTREVPDA